MKIEIVMLKTVYDFDINILKYVVDKRIQQWTAVINTLQPS